MSSENTIDVLNQFVAIHNRSLPVYLGYASPTWFRGDEVAREATTEGLDTVDRVLVSQHENGVPDRVRGDHLAIVAFGIGSLEISLERHVHAELDEIVLTGTSPDLRQTDVRFPVGYPRQVDGHRDLLLAPGDDAGRAAPSAVLCSGLLDSLTRPATGHAT